jgi:Ni,Fe-hydrogenase maturation factor
MKILVFGNPLLEYDNIPLKLIPDLQKLFPKLEFVEFDPTENLEKQGRNLIIIDTVQGINKVTEINSIDQISKSKLFSMHDFDLGYNLKILQKLNLIDSIKIIGVPMKIEKQEAIEKIGKILKKHISF